MLLMAGFGLSGCFGLGGGGGGGAGGGGAGGGGFGTGTPIPGDGMIVASTATGHGRVIAQNITVKPSDPTNPIITYGVSDQTADRGQAVSLSAVDLSGKAYGQLNLASSTDTLENGASSVTNIDGNYRDTLKGSAGGVSNNYVLTPTKPGESVSSLSIVDFDYARAGFGIRLDPIAGRIVEWAFFGGNSDTVDRPGSVSGSATYTGQAGARVLTRDMVVAAQGDLTLSANVSGAGVIDGKIDNIVLTLTDGSQFAYDGAMLLENGTLSGADFTGAVSVVDSTGATMIDTSGSGRGTFQGGFYGSGAEEVAGGFDLIGNGTDPVSGNFGRIDIYGVFVGKK